MILSTPTLCLVFILLCSSTLAYPDEINKKDREFHHIICKFLVHFAGYRTTQTFTALENMNGKQKSRLIEKILKTITVYDHIKQRRLSPEIVRFFREQEDSYKSISLPTVILRQTATMLTSNIHKLPEKYRSWLFSQKSDKPAIKKLRYHLELFIDDLSESYDQEDEPPKDEVTKHLQMYASDLNKSLEAWQKALIQFHDNNTSIHSLTPVSQPVGFHRYRHWYENTVKRLASATQSPPTPVFPTPLPLSSARFSLKFMKKVALWQLNLYDLEMELNRLILGMEHCSQRANFLGSVSHFDGYIDSLKEAWGPENSENFIREWREHTQSNALKELNDEIINAIKSGDPVIRRYNALVEEYNSNPALARILPDNYFDAINNGLLKPEQIKKIMESLELIQNNCADIYNQKR